MSARFGVVRVVEKQRECVACEGGLAGSVALREFVPPGETYAYDTIAFVGWLYFREGLNHKTIRERFEKRTGKVLPPRSVGHLVRKFVEYVACVHTAAAPKLNEEFARFGGYVLHIDGTCESGSDVLVLGVARVDGRTWVLDAEKLSTEHEEGIGQLAQRIRDDFGLWLGSVRDLSTAMKNGLSSAAKGKPQFECQAHFVRDVGKKLLGPPRQDLVNAFTKWQVTRKLNESRKYARRVLKDKAADKSAEALEVLLDTPELESDLPDSFVDRGLTCLWSQWMRAYRSDGKGQSFPFAHPELNYVERCIEAYQALQSLRKERFKDPSVKDTVEKLLDIVRPVCEEPEFVETTRRYREALNEFDKLRTPLRVGHQRAKTYTWNGSPENRVRQAQALEQHLTDYRDKVEKRLAGRLSSERRRCLEIIAKDLRNHWAYLRGHVLLLAEGAECTVVVVERSNNLLESLIGVNKRDFRRRNGQKHVGRELQSLPAEAVLTLNLRDDRYMELVYGGGGWERMAEVFPEVYEAVQERRDRSRHVRLCDVRLGPKQLRSHEMPERFTQVYKQQLSDTEA